MTDEAYLATFHTERNTTTMIVLAPETDHLFSYEGTYSIVAIEAASSDDYIQVILPSSTSLNSVYPNPFNPSTNINYVLSSTGKINLSIYNISGQLIETLVSGYQDAGSYDLVWDASLKSSGMYFLRLHTADAVYHQKLMLIK